jgi:hypothetical protein
MSEPMVATTEQPLTPAQAMYDVLANTGYVHQKVDFARIVRINDRNIYSYLGDPDSDSSRGFIVASLEKLHGWANAIVRETGIRIEMRLFPEGNLVLIAEGQSKNGHPFGPILYTTVYDRYPWGFRPAGGNDEGV